MDNWNHNLVIELPICICVERYPIYQANAMISSGGFYAFQVWIVLSQRKALNKLL